MGALTNELSRFLDGQPVGVLATRSAEGNPRQSLVYFAREGDRLVVSTLANRLKAQDVRRSGWASLCVMAHEPPYPSATFSGPAEILTENIGLSSRFGGDSSVGERELDASAAEVDHCDERVGGVESVCAV